MGFVLGLVCLIIADIIGQSYSHSPPPSLHSSNNQIWCWEKCSQARKEERHSSEQGEKNYTTVPTPFFFFVCLFWGGGTFFFSITLETACCCVIMLRVSLIAGA